MIYDIQSTDKYYSWNKRSCQVGMSAHLLEPRFLLRPAWLVNSAGNATPRRKTGDRVHVDGGKGTGAILARKYQGKVKYTANNHPIEATISLGIPGDGYPYACPPGVWRLPDDAQGPQRNQGSFRADDTIFLNSEWIRKEYVDHTLRGRFTRRYPALYHFK